MFYIVNFCKKANFNATGCKSDFLHYLYSYVVMLKRYYMACIPEVKINFLIFNVEISKIIFSF